MKIEEGFRRVIEITSIEDYDMLIYIMEHAHIGAFDEMGNDDMTLHVLDKKLRYGKSEIEKFGYKFMEAIRKTSTKSATNKEDE